MSGSRRVVTCYAGGHGLRAYSSSPISGGTAAIDASACVSSRRVVQLPQPFPLQGGAWSDYVPLLCLPEVSGWADRLTQLALVFSVAGLWANGGNWSDADAENDPFLDFFIQWLDASRGLGLTNDVFRMVSSKKNLRIVFTAFTGALGSTLVQSVINSVLPTSLAKMWQNIITRMSPTISPWDMKMTAQTIALSQLAAKVSTEWFTIRARLLIVSKLVCAMLSFMLRLWRAGWSVANIAAVIPKWLIAYGDAMKPEIMTLRDGGRDE